jgi:glucosyl-3-phosphoglycerate phosphatase
VNRLLLIRHGQSTWNAEQRWQGHADPPLSPLGEQQAREAGRRLKDEAGPVSTIVASDLGRAHTTARLLAGELGLDPEGIVLEPGLRERDVGDWSGLTRAEIEERWPGKIEAWRNGDNSAIPGGEGDITPRIAPVVERLAAEANGTTIAVTHGGVVHAVERYLEIELVRTGNLCGRWVHWEGGKLLPGDTFILAAPDPEATTTVL